MNLECEVYSLFFPVSFVHQLFFVSAFKMVAVNVVALIPKITQASEGALTTAKYLRVSSMAVAAYEYVVRRALLMVIVT